LRSVSRKDCSKEYCSERQKEGLQALATGRAFFELADSGTMFLDEIDSMPSSLQAKLLRVLSEKRLRRVGDIKERIVDVRVVAAMTRLA